MFTIRRFSDWVIDLVASVLFAIAYLACAGIDWVCGDRDE
jgi:hypothetical protein